MTALDLFCGGGAVCEGLQRLGYDVTGIDNDPRCEKYYPGTFRIGDATAIDATEMARYDLVWCSPPCQLFSIASSRANRIANHFDHLTPLRMPLLTSGARWIIENVPHAPMRPDVRVNGTLMGLPRIARERWFDVSHLPFGWSQPILHTAGLAKWEAGEMCTITKSLCHGSHYYPRKRLGLPGRIPKHEAMEVMGITHDMTCEQIGEAVPPAYAEYVAGLVMAAGAVRRW